MRADRGRPSYPPTTSDRPVPLLEDRPEPHTLLSVSSPAEWAFGGPIAH